MEEFANPSIGKASINVSRNSPVALVVGAAGFLGSSLIEKLLDHNISVIGADDFTSGKRENLETATKNNHFHLINSRAENLKLDIPRLDYIFILAGENWSTENVLSLAEEFSSKIVFISWIDLYSHKSHLPWFKKTESEIAEFAKDHSLNARVVRLAPIFGPRMNFDVADPIITLIKASIENNLQEEGTSLDFSTRALFIDDATNLIIKSMLAGSTAWKIFDGANKSPIKISEVKQVLLDPVWHENRGFTPTELPPWPTPNLEKTEKELHWHPKVELVEALKQTVVYFKEHEYNPVQKFHVGFERMVEVKEEIKKEITKEIEVVPEKPPKKKREVRVPKIAWGKILAIMIIFYAFIYPALTLGLGLSFLSYQESKAIENLEKGEYEESLNNIKKAKGAQIEIKNAISPFLSISNLVLKDQTASINRQLTLNEQTLTSIEHLNLGVREFKNAFKAITGASSDSPDKSLEIANTELQAAETAITAVSLNSKNNKIVDNLSSVIKQSRVLASSLPKFIGEGQKTYLVILEDSSELRPTGGLIRAVGVISFNKGKLASIETKSPSEFNPKNITPPAEIKEDLGVTNLNFEDANWDPDFSNSAKQLGDLYTSATGVEVDGIISLDLFASKDLLSKTGPLSIANSSKISADNLITSANLKQGSELVTFLGELLNRTFYLSSDNWMQTMNSLDKSLKEKHVLLNFKDIGLQTISSKANFTGEIIRDGGNNLSLIESNMGKNKVNEFLDRSLNIEVKIDTNGVVLQRLQVNLSNRSVNNVWPGGTLKDRVRVYVPIGSKLISFKWGNEDLTSEVSVASDFGMTVYSSLLTLSPKETKILTLDYELPIKLKYESGKANFSLNIIKQPGTGSDPIQVKLPGGVVSTGNFSTDRKIEAILTR